MADVAKTTDGMLDPELKAKWVAALRGGKYEQGTEYLRTENGFCCLGVLCDVVNPEAWTKDEAWAFGDEGQREEDIAELPGLFRRSIGIDQSDMAELISMNDEQHYSFGEIADWIETNL